MDFRSFAPVRLGCRLGVVVVLILGLSACGMKVSDVDVRQRFTIGDPLATSAQSPEVQRFLTAKHVCGTSMNVKRVEPARRRGVDVTCHYPKWLGRILRPDSQ